MTNQLKTIVVVAILIIGTACITLYAHHLINHDQEKLDGSYASSVLNEIISEKLKSIETEVVRIQNNQAENTRAKEAIEFLTKEMEKPNAEIFAEELNKKIASVKAPENFYKAQRFKSKEIHNLSEIIWNRLNINRFNNNNLTFDTHSTSVLQQIRFDIEDAIRDDYYWDDFDGVDSDPILDINEIVSEYSLKLNNLRSVLNRSVTLLNEENYNLVRDAAKIHELKEKITSAQKDYAESYGNQSLISTALPLFAIVILLLVVIPIFFAKGKIGEFVFGQGLLIQMVTIFLLIVTILILGLGNILKAEILGTLLGGISVYVLQKSTKDDFDRAIATVAHNQQTLANMNISGSNPQTPPYTNSEGNPGVRGSNGSTAQSIIIPKPVPSEGQPFSEDDLKPFENR